MKNKRVSTRRPAVGDKLNLTLNMVEPLTDNQIEMFNSDKHVVAHGCAGTGKTFVASFLAYRDIIKLGRYDHLVYIRSAVPARNMGFLPGTDKEKAEIYEPTYRDIANELFSRGDAYDILKIKNVTQFVTTSYLRGTTMRDSVIIVDECQNMSYQELDTVITRVGDNCRIFFCGDRRQPDLRKSETGIVSFYDVLRTMPEFDFVEFGIEDVVRGPLVKSYLTHKHALYGDREFS